MDKVLSAFGSVLKKHQVANVLGVSQDSYSRYANGKQVAPLVLYSDQCSDEVWEVKVPVRIEV